MTTSPESPHQHPSNMSSKTTIDAGEPSDPANVEKQPVKVDGTSIPPEEGRQGWLVVLGAFICMFCSFGFLAAIGVFQTYYEETILSSYPPSSIAWIFAVQLCLMWAPGPLFGRITDTYGPGPVLYPSAFLCVFSLCMTSLCTEYYQIFLAQGLGFGLGAGGIFSPSLICTGQWFVRRRGMATGIVTAGSSLGGVIFPIFFQQVQKQVGFDGAVRYTALFIGILLVAACFLVKARLPKKQWNPNLKWFDISLFKQKQFSLYTFGASFVMWGLWAPFDYLPAMSQSNGFSPDLALYLISIVNAASTPGRLLPPYLGDKIGHFNVMTVVSTLTGGSMLALWLPFQYHPSHVGIIIFASVYGFVSGSVVSLLMPCCVKTGSIETIGVRFGTFQFMIAIANLTGLPIMGAILDTQHGDFMGLIVFGGVVVLTGATLIAGSTHVLRKSSSAWKV